MQPASPVPLVLVLPFALLLLAIAALPLAAAHWWERNRSKAIVAALLSLPVAVWLLARAPAELAHTAHEYVSFIVLLGSLFTISGGLFLDGDLRATPRVNTAFLALGAVLANLIGTTGASMLLIRPLLRTNSQRTHVVHTVVFFIFVVSNAGGCLTPLGDPPLFMGYLRGVPFGWTFSLWPEWLGVVGALLTVYYVWDSVRIRRESREALRLDLERFEPLRLQGAGNLVLLLGVVAAVAFITPALFLGPGASDEDARTAATCASLLRDGTMAACAAGSLLLTPKQVRARNAFTWGPMVEVAVLFAGIFVTMVPATMVLEARGGELGVDTPREMFWAAGALSSFLDNAPTYVAFTSTASGIVSRTHPGVTSGHLGTLLAVPEGAAFLRAISLGAVFMGANTYIGNGPNFMVKAIADASGVKMPSFFRYMGYAAVVLLPVFAVVSLLAF
jgi:Na+/H+ antiporter NhaD/arsenite permease-like protein